jgi:hypothetical protein
MAKKKKARVAREPTTTTTVTKKPRAAIEHYNPRREVIEIHTKTEKNRNASGEVFGGRGTLLPILGGVAGGTAAVMASQKWSAHPGLVAAGAAGAGLLAMTMGKQSWLRQAGAGAVVGAAVVGAVPLVVGAFQSSPQQQAAHAPSPTPQKAAPHRGADGTGDGFITRQELNDALSKVADQQKQGHCDLLSALDDIRKIVANAEEQQDRALPAQRPPQILPAATTAQARAMFDRTSLTRAADGDDTYARNAYGDEYERNAYGDDERNATVDEYERNAYGDEGERNADLDERNAAVDEYERNAYGDEYERNAFVDDERNADLDERNAFVDDERNADLDERNADDLN